MQDETLLFPDKERLTNALFNQLVYFGQASAPSAPPMLDEEPFYHIFADREIKTQQFIKLFAQSVFLHVFLSQPFPNSFLEQRIRPIVKDMLHRLCENTEISPSTSAEIIASLLQNMDQALQNLCTKIQQGQGIPKNNIFVVRYEECRDACKKFLDDVREKFQVAQPIISSIEDDMPLTNIFITHCLRPFHLECEYGRSWVARFFDYKLLRCARTDLKYLSGKQKHHLGLETLYDEKERFIKCTIAPCLALEEFIRIPLYIFHEYVSHLSANIQRVVVEDTKQRKAGIRAHKAIRTALDEGWMVHVEKVFLEDKMHELLEGKREYLQYTIKLSVEDWITSIHYAYRDDEAYIEEARAGAEIAEKFLTFLRYNICMGDEGKAKALYYRLSFDLITHALSPTFDHQQFMANIFQLCQTQKDFLIKAIQGAIQMGGNTINIEFLWYCIKGYRLEPTLKIS